MAQKEMSQMISIIPGGCIQFVDRQFDVAGGGGKLRLYFSEEAVAGGGHVNLYCLEQDEETGGFIKRGSNPPEHGGYDYEIDGQKALDIFLDQWIPVPFLRLKPEHWADGSPRFEQGPSNWARVYVTRAPEGAAFSHNVTLAFDTVIEERPPEHEPYYALAPDDVSGNAQFALANHERDNVWFLNSEWIDDWLRDCLTSAEARRRKGKRAPSVEEQQYQFKHLANYLTFLELLSRGDILPSVRVVDPSRYIPIDVDLVIDIGNSRTCGILVETRPQATTNLNDSYVLQIRDLTYPDRVHTEPFETRVEFAEASFGNNRLSARSGRENEAFVWPSVVRIGPEAARLGARSWGGEGNTGMSSPKRYLWDERPRQQQWRYNGFSPDGVREPPATRGLFVQYLNKEGSPLDRLDDPEVRQNPVLRKQSKTVAFESVFSRSSMMMFLLSELISHALLTINSPAQRATREHSDIPRRLRRIIVTVPTAMPLSEQKVFRRWTRWAVGMVWRTLGWYQDFYVAKGRPQAKAERPDYRLSPEIRCEWDEATCSQLIFIYNELTEKYQGDVHFLFRLLGKQRPEYGKDASLRIASIDIGGGTTDLSITTYEVMGDESSTGRIRPHIDFRDGFNIAGDDILSSVIEDHFLPELQEAITKSGASDPRGLLNRLFGRDVIGQSQADRNRRGQFGRQVAATVGLGLLSLYEGSEDNPTNDFVRKVRDFFPGDSLGEELVSYVDDAVNKAGGGCFSLADMEMKISLAGVDRTVAGEVGRILSNLCEVIHQFDCDLLLITGRPSRWPAVTNSVLAKLPVAPDRVLPLAKFRVGRWFPFADHLGRISDPKTTVVVGAILSALAEGHLEGFAIDTVNMRLKSTARFIGEMDLESKLKRQRVWFEVDCDSNDERDYEHEVSFSGPLAIGFRQVDAERWPTTRFYMLDFAHPEARANSQGRLPYKVSLTYQVPGNEDIAPNAEREEGELAIDSIVAYDDGGVLMADLEVRLQTLPSYEGYWLDTGIFNVV